MDTSAVGRRQDIFRQSLSRAREGQDAPRSVLRPLASVAEANHTPSGEAVKRTCWKLPADTVASVVNDAPTSCHRPPFVPSGADRCRLVYSWNMNRAGAVRQSISLPSLVAKRVRAIAKTRKLSANRVLVDLIETGLQARESERERFLTLARRFKESSDPDESDRLREELAHLIFGE